MNKHANGLAACPSCEDKLKNAHPDLAAWFRDSVKKSFPDCHISWSYRGKEDQEKAFLDGKSKLHFPLSAHNKSDDQGNPCALALDFFQLDFHGQACWPWGYFRDIANKAANDAIFWGGHWPQFADSDHFQLRAGSGIPIQ